MEPDPSFRKDVAAVLGVLVGLPIDAIERLAAAGARAAGPLADGLRRPPGRDRLPAILALGRLPFDAAIEPLLDFLREDSDPPLCSAAAGTLAEGGERAVWPLIEIVEGGRGAGRYWATVALGATGSAEALKLLRGLLDAPDSALAAAHALAEARDLEAAPLIHRAFVKLPEDSRQSPHYTLALERCHARPLEPSPWFVEWRRKPHEWEPKAGSGYGGWFKASTDPGARLPNGIKWPKKPLEYYRERGSRHVLTETPYPCPRCRILKTMVLGAWKCPEEALPFSLSIERLLRGAKERGETGLAGILDGLDMSAWVLGEKWMLLPSQRKLAWINTKGAFETMMTDGLRSIEDGIEAVRAGRSRLDKAFS